VVVVSILPLGYFVHRLAEDSVRIETLIPPGATPHTHEPGMTQLRTIASAALFVKVGHPRFPFEQEWVDRMVATNQTIRIVDGFAGVARNQQDPHVWTSPRAVRRLVDNLVQPLTEIVPAQRAAILRRRDGLLREVDQVERELRDAFTGLRSRRFYVLHAAWGYLAEDYGLEQVDLEQQGKDPRSLALLTERAKEDHVKVVFVQPQVSRQNAELVARDVGAGVEVIDPLAYDWVDNMRRVAAAFRRALS
jgi:zinc transport system substrate-binding protein